MENLVKRITRPTISSIQNTVVWSPTRISYQVQFYNSSTILNRNYYKCPSLPKHYPGTWRSAQGKELRDIIDRVSRPTIAYIARSNPTAACELAMSKRMRKPSSKSSSASSKDDVSSGMCGHLPKERHHFLRGN